MALHQIDSETTESIKEAKAICTHSIQEAETHCSTAIREVEARGSPRPAPFSNHMLKPFNALKKKPSKRRVRVNSTSSPPVKPP